VKKNSGTPLAISRKHLWISVLAVADTGMPYMSYMQTENEAGCPSILSNVQDRQWKSPEDYSVQGAPDIDAQESLEKMGNDACSLHDQRIPRQNYDINAPQRVENLGREDLEWCQRQQKEDAHNVFYEERAKRQEPHKQFYAQKKIRIEYLLTETARVLLMQRVRICVESDNTPKPVKYFYAMVRNGITREECEQSLYFLINGVENKLYQAKFVECREIIKHVCAVARILGLRGFARRAQCLYMKMEREFLHSSISMIPVRL